MDEEKIEAARAALREFHAGIRAARAKAKGGLEALDLSWDEWRQIDGASVIDGSRSIT